MSARKKERPLARIKQFLLQRSRNIAIVCYFLTAFSACAVTLLARPVRVDENALLAGHAASSYTTASLDVFREVYDSMKMFKGVDDLEEAKKTVRDLRFDAMVHRPRSGERTTCRCMAAVARAPGGDGKECVVLVSPVGGRTESDRDSNSIAFATAAGVMHHLRTQTWLAKDVLWIIPDATCGAQRALRQWLEAYHSPGDHPLEGEKEEESRIPRIGQLSAALVLQGGNGSGMRVHALGANGALPNLDLVATVQHIMRQMGVRIAPLDIYQSLRTLFNFIWEQALGIPSGLHGEFRRFHVDAVTVEGGLIREGIFSSIVALTIRSLSNIGEKFHHSTFLYAFTAPDMVITIRDYVALVGLILLSLVFETAHLNQELHMLGKETYSEQGAGSDLHLHRECDGQGSKRDEAVASGTSGLGTGLSDARRRLSRAPKMLCEQAACDKVQKRTDWSSVLMVTVLLHAWGLTSGGVLLLAAYIQQHAWVALLAMLFYMIYSLYVGLWPLLSLHNVHVGIEMLRVSLYCSSAVGLACLAALNWSLVFTSGLVFFPMCLSARPLGKSKGFYRIALLLTWVGTSPFFLLVLAAVFSRNPLHDLLYAWASQFLEYGVLSFIACFGIFLPLFIVNTALLFG